MNFNSILKHDFLIFGILVSQVIRWSVSRWPYSGANKPPMFGDYEAQRHWMEITVNLPLKDWYKHTPQNDLYYWGLDYPPLTAYQSLLFGHVANLFNPNWVSINSSRGYESYEHKIFMRSTVIALDLLVFYVPAILYWINISEPSKLRDKAVAASLMLVYPALILIDHGHFQYNCVSLGFTLWAIFFLLKSHDLLASLFFCLSLHYKQMSLYHALPFFCYLLGRCLKSDRKSGLVQLSKLSFVVILTSIICWAPFLQSYDVFTSVVSRLFPLDRGLFEDKVANVWCSLSVLIKFRKLFSQPTLVKISAVCTLLASLPSSFFLLKTPNFKMFLLSLVNVSLAFFLFSYQVHEKSVLLVALPVLLLLHDHPLVCTWFLMISTFSLVPLLAKDGLIIPYFSLSVMFITSIVRAYEVFKPRANEIHSRVVIYGCMLSLLISLGLVIAMFNVHQPKRYPHLHVLLNCVYSCAHLVGFAVYFNYLQYKLFAFCMSKKHKQL